jgi:hypothetical protein
MADNEIMDLTSVDEVETCNECGSKLDTATTIFCVTGSAIAIGGVVKKYGKKLWDHLPLSKAYKEAHKVEESTDVE